MRIDRTAPATRCADVSPSSFSSSDSDGYFSKRVFVVGGEISSPTSSCPFEVCAKARRECVAFTVAMLMTDVRC